MADENGIASGIAETVRAKHAGYKRADGCHTDQYCRYIKHRSSGDWAINEYTDLDKLAMG